MKTGLIGPTGGRAFCADDAWMLAAGDHATLYEVLGAHPDTNGTTFRVWAPSASEVSVVGSIDNWSGEHRLEPDPSGVWRAHLEGWAPGMRYKYRVVSADRSHTVDKADPVGALHEIPPATASVIHEFGHEWGDSDWMATRHSRHGHDKAISIYEVHLGSWRFEPGGYQAIATQLADYCVDLGFTHVELLPVMEHPFYGSWGYQTTGYFAPTARYGSPDDFAAAVDIFHQAGIGVILDWVPSHFPTDEHGLGHFDGTHLYEHADPKQGFHPDWTSFVFNYGRNEVRSFLLSSAHYWLDRFHVDGLRVDAVASMLYLDYSRQEGGWIPNDDGGNENREAIRFLQELNRSVYATHPGVMMIAEESTAWPGVTNPTDMGGLGFGFKWDMGWMNDTLSYFSQDPVVRRWHHDAITFRSVYSASEHYLVPLSHDEVTHGKGSLLSKMPGDRWQKFANLRLLFGHQWTAPGKPLLFMGGEFGVEDEWSHESELNWGLLGDELNGGLQGWVRELNRVVLARPAFWQRDRDPAGFAWLVDGDTDQSVMAWTRIATDDHPMVCIMNHTPVPRYDYRLGVPQAGQWRVALNSDDIGWGGSGVAAFGQEHVSVQTMGAHGHQQSVEMTLPPLALVVLEPVLEPTEPAEPIEPIDEARR